MQLSVSRPISLVVAATGEDEQFAWELQRHLSLIDARELTCWSSYEIGVGLKPVKEIQGHGQQADLFLLLLSPDFFASSDCLQIMELARERAQEGLALVLPVLLRPVDVAGTSFQQSELLPRSHQPVSQWPDRDQAWTEITQLIRALVARFHVPILLAADPQLAARQQQINEYLTAACLPCLSWSHELESLREVMRRVSAVVVLLSADTYYDRHVQAIRDVAESHGHLLIILWDGPQSPDTILPKSWRGQKMFPIWMESSSLLLDLLSRLQKRFEPILVASQIPLPDIPRNPYKGLHAFQQTDARDFFGRTDMVQELLSALQVLQDENQARLLAVVGPSGSGKSSVVRAGLLARLVDGDLVGSDRWVRLILPPLGNDPLEALMLSLVPYLGEISMQAIYDTLRTGSASALHEYALRIAQKQTPPAPHVLLVIDQMEELFQSTGANDVDRRRFLSLLLTAITVQDGPLLVVLTLRVDYPDQLVAFPDFCQIIDTHSHRVPAMTISEMRDAIEQPANLPGVQVQFDEHLVSDMLLDLQEQSGALPLLQFALEQLFEARKGYQLTRAAYQQIGGVTGAIDQQANTTYYQRLPSDQHREAARTIFLRLVTSGASEQEVVRKRVFLSALPQSRTPIVEETINAFVGARLLTRSDQTLEVSHEAVLQKWSLLVDWIRDGHKDLLQQQALDYAIEQWERYERKEDWLLSDYKQLTQIKKWARRNPLNEREQAFVQASSRRRKRSLLLVSVAILLVLVTIGGTLGWGWWQDTHRPPPDPTRVVTTQDSGIGSLPWCLANAHAGSTITIDPRAKGIITLNNPLTINKPLTVKGPGERVLALRSLGAYAMDISATTGIVSISDLSFTQGSPSTQGSIIMVESDSAVHLNHITISHNHEVGIVNGGGTLTIANSTISDNTLASLDGVNTGGIWNYSGTATITNSTISGNSAANVAKLSAGGVLNNGAMTIDNSTISDNSAPGSNTTAGIGGIWNDRGVMTITNSTISGNSAPGVNRPSVGGIDNTGSMSIVKSTVSGNSSSDDGGLSTGGLLNGISSATIAVMDSLIADNSSISGGNLGIGGVFNNGGTMKLINSTISGNVAPIITGIASILNAQTTLFFCTVIENTGNGISIGNSNGENASVMTVQDSIIATTSIVVAQASSAFRSNGYNLTNTPNASFFQQTGDRVIQDLSTLFGNGALPTQSDGVIQIRVGSAAYNAIPVNACHISEIYNGQTKTYTDQLGQLRPGKGKTQCDIGAYETQL